MLGDTIREARERLGWTQAALARQVGATPGFITKLEKNEALPGQELLLALANVLKLDAEPLRGLADRTRQGRAGQRVRTRGAAVRGVVTRRPEDVPPAAEPSGVVSAHGTAGQGEPESPADPHGEETPPAVLLPDAAATTLSALKDVAEVIRKHALDYAGYFLELHQLEVERAVLDWQTHRDDSRLMNDLQAIYQQALAGLGEMHRTVSTVRQKVSEIRDRIRELRECSKKGGS
jgi:transcriptional regulator with XRE-family HTH domain